MAGPTGSDLFIVKNLKSGKLFSLSSIDQVNAAERHLVQNEVNLIESIESQNIVQCVDLFDHDRTLYIINECLGPMTQIVAKGHTRYSEDFCRYTLYRVTRALSEIHARGIVYGDVCAANVMCNETGTVKLANLSTAVAL